MAIAFLGQLGFCAYIFNEIREVTVGCCFTDFDGKAGMTATTSLTSEDIAGGGKGAADFIILTIPLEADGGQGDPGFFSCLRNWMPSCCSLIAPEAVSI